MDCVSLLGHRCPVHIHHSRKTILVFAQELFHFLFFIFSTLCHISFHHLMFATIIKMSQPSMDAHWMDAFDASNESNGQSEPESEFPEIEGSVEPVDSPVKLPAIKSSQSKTTKTTSIKMSAQDAATHLVPLSKKTKSSSVSSAPSSPAVVTPAKRATARRKPTPKPAAPVEPLGAGKKDKKTVIKKQTDLTSDVGFGNDDELCSFGDTVGDELRHMALRFYYKITAKISFINDGKAYCLPANFGRVVDHIQHETGYPIKTIPDPADDSVRYFIVSYKAYEKEHAASTALFHRLQTNITRKQFPKCELDLVAKPWSINGKRGFSLELENIEVSDKALVQPPPKRRKVVQPAHVSEIDEPEFDTEVNEIPETP